VSIGVATIPGSATGDASLVESADQALLSAKRLGKQRVELAA
jgi:PleD family two-component response regulator